MVPTGAGRSAPPLSPEPERSEPAMPVVGFLNSGSPVMLPPGRFRLCTRPAPTAARGERDARERGRTSIREQLTKLAGHIVRADLFLSRNRGTSWEVGQGASRPGEGAANAASRVASGIAFS
jgi:hypothetical protein